MEEREKTPRECILSENPQRFVFRRAGSPHDAGVANETGSVFFPSLADATGQLATRRNPC